MRKVCEVYLISDCASDDEQGIYLPLPASRYEMMDALEQIQETSPDNIYWRQEGFYCFGYIAPHLDDCMSLFEFNALTEQLSKLDKRQETALEGLLQMQTDKHRQENSGPITTQELMMLAHNAGCCEVLADVHSEEDLGKFYVDNDFLPELTDLPDSVYDLLDYVKIGRQMHKSEDGVFTRNGYVVRTQELQPLPDYRTQHDINYMIRLTLTDYENEQKTAVLDLPATKQQMQAVQKELDALEWYDAEIINCDAIAPHLNTVPADAGDIPKLNELAQALQELKDSGRLTKFKAVIEATSCKTLNDVFDRLEKLPQYCFEAKIRDKDTLVRDELELILGGKEADLIYNHLLCSDYAKDVLKQYGAKLTLYGLVNRADFGPLNEPIPEQQQEQTQEPQVGM